MVIAASRAECRFAARQVRGRSAEIKRHMPGLSAFHRIRQRRMPLSSSWRTAAPAISRRFQLRIRFWRQFVPLHKGGIPLLRKSICGPTDVGSHGASDRMKSTAPRLVFSFFKIQVCLLVKISDLYNDSRCFSIDAWRAILYNNSHVAKILSERVGVRRFSPERTQDEPFQTAKIKKRGKTHELY